MLWEPQLTRIQGLVIAQERFVAFAVAYGIRGPHQSRPHLHYFFFENDLHDGDDAGGHQVLVSSELCGRPRKCQKPATLQIIHQLTSEIRRSVEKNCKLQLKSFTNISNKIVTLTISYCRFLFMTRNKNKHSKRHT